MTKIISVNNEHRKISLFDNEGKLFVLGADSPIFEGKLLECPNCGKLQLVSELIGTDEGVMCSSCIDENEFSVCAVCGTYTTDPTETAPGEEVCPDCLSRYYSECDECGEYYPDDELEHVAGIGQVCPSCIENNNYEECHCCGERASDLTEVAGGDLVCDDCLEYHYRVCDECGQFVPESDTRYVTDHGYICPDCFEALVESGEFPTCALCGETIFDEDDVCDGWDGEVLCYDCYRELNTEGYCEWIAPYHGSRDPRFKSLVSDVESPRRGNLYLGMELELPGVGKNNDELAEILDEEYGFKCEHDCSVFAGFETISDAMTLLYWKENVDIAGMIAECDKAGHRLHDKSGIHVHVSRGPLTEQAAVEAGWFVHTHYGDCIKFGRRNPDKVDYCAKSRWVNNKEGVLGMEGHGTAVNFHDSTNFELRFFKTSKDVNHIWAILEFAYTLGEVAKAGTEDITWADLRAFAESKGNLCENFLAELNAGFENEETAIHDYDISDELKAMA